MRVGEASADVRSPEMDLLPTLPPVQPAVGRDEVRFVQTTGEFLRLLFQQRVVDGHVSRARIGEPDGQRGLHVRRLAASLSLARRVAAFGRLVDNAFAPLDDPRDLRLGAVVSLGDVRLRHVLRVEVQHLYLLLEGQIGSLPFRAHADRRFGLQESNEELVRLVRLVRWRCNQNGT